MSTTRGPLTAGHPGRRGDADRGQRHPLTVRENGIAGVVRHPGFSTPFSYSRRLPEIKAGGPSGRVSGESFDFWTVTLGVARWSVGDSKVMAEANGGGAPGPGWAAVGCGAVVGWGAAGTVCSAGCPAVRAAVAGVCAGRGRRGRRGPGGRGGALGGGFRSGELRGYGAREQTRTGHLREIAQYLEGYSSQSSPKCLTCDNGCGKPSMNKPPGARQSPNPARPA